MTITTKKCCVLWDFIYGFLPPLSIYRSPSSTSVIARDTKSSGVVDYPLFDAKMDVTSVYDMSATTMVDVITKCGFKPGFNSSKLFDSVMKFSKELETGKMSDKTILSEINAMAKVTAGSTATAAIEAAAIKIILDRFGVDQSYLSSSSAVKHLDYEYMITNINQVCIAATMAQCNGRNKHWEVAIADAFKVKHDDKISSLGQYIVFPLTSRFVRASDSGYTPAETFVQTTLATLNTSTMNIPNEQSARQRIPELLFKRFTHVIIPNDSFFSVYGPQDSRLNITSSMTIMDALPYVNPAYPLTPFAVHTNNKMNLVENKERYFNQTLMNSKCLNPCNFMFSNGYPYLPNTRTYGFQAYLEQYKCTMMNENAYHRFQKTFFDVEPYYANYVLAHHICYPRTGNPFITEKDNHPISIFEERWIRLHRLDSRFLMGGKLALFNTNSGPSLSKAYDADIDSIAGAIVISPWEEQLDNSIIAVSKGRLGTMYTNQKTLDPLETEITDKITRREQNVGEMMFGTFWQHPQKAIVIDSALGSDIVGGNGRGWFDTLLERPAILSSISHEYIEGLKRFMFDGEKVGNKSNIAIVTGMSMCIGETSHTERHFEMAGYNHRKDYVEVLHQSTNFENDQNKILCPGSPFTAYVFDPDHRRGSFANISYQNITMAMREQWNSFNTVCDPTTIKIIDSNKTNKILVGSHARGYQGVNCRHKDSGFGKVGNF